MILVNGREFQWDNDITVEELLKLKKFTYPRIVVVINDNIVPYEMYSSALVKDGDNVQVIHLMAGG